MEPSTVESRPVGPAWASALGVVAVVLGIFLAAMHGNELMSQSVLTLANQGGSLETPAECPEEELIEENLSLGECLQMVNNVEGVLLSRPEWFRGFMIVLMSVGTVMAFVSILVGAILVDYRRWAPAAAVVVFAVLAGIDLLGFIGALNTGPILRAMYLSQTLLWFAIHLMMTLGAFVGRQREAAAA